MSLLYSIIILTVLALSNTPTLLFTNSFQNGDSLTIHTHVSTFNNKIVFSDKSIVQEIFLVNKIDILDKSISANVSKYILISRSDKSTTKYVVDNSYRLLAKLNIGNGISIYYVLLNRDQLENLLKSKNTYSVVENTLFYRNILDYFRTKILFGRIVDNLDTVIAENYYDYLPSLDLIKAPVVWNNYSLMGENVTIGIVDTGVDFANPDLGLDSIARDIHGNPLLLTIDNGLILFTNVSERINDKLVTENTIVKVFDPLSIELYSVRLSYNVTIGSINSLTGVYKVGLIPYYSIALHLSNVSRVVWVKTHVLAIMVDEEIPGVYNRVYFDLSTAFYELSITIREVEKKTLGYSLWREPLYEWLDYSIADEQFFEPGFEIVARDFDSDGLYDFSLGTISGYYLDTLGLINNTPSYYVGWDYSGRYLSIMNDYMGHGTRVATVLVGRGSREYIGYSGLFRVRGIAPLSRIATGSVLWSYDTFILEAWLCGYIPIFRKIDDIYYIEFNYYGPRRADVVNNSWSYVNTMKTLQNSPGLDIITYIFDTIVFNRTFIAREPVVLVFASGNSGPGYSSIHSPSTGLLTITVGASTWFKLLLDYGYSGLYDEIAPFSSRGPSAQGYSKPDLVSIGMFEYTSTRVVDGLGYGSVIDVFMGTSLATPYVTGALALLLNAYRNIYGQNTSLDPIIAKIILKNSCEDLGYTPFIQGSGRLNVLKAVERILLNKPIVYIDNGLKNAFIENYINAYGEYIHSFLSLLCDTSHYDVVKQATVKNFTVFISNYIGEINISSRELVYYKELVVYDNVYDFKNTLRIEIPRYAYVYSDYIELIILLENISYPPYMFTSTPFDNKHSIITYLIDWRDLDSDKVIDNYEQYIISMDYRYCVETYLSISKPDEKIAGKLLVQIEPSIYSSVEPIDLKILVRAYNFRESNLLVYERNMFVSNSCAINISINVSENTIPGVYETALIIEYSGDKILLPVSVLVPLVLDNLSTVLIGLEYSNHRYYTFRLRGLYDIYSSYECSDWRILPIIVTEPDITGVLFIARWSSGYSTDLAFTVIPPNGVFTEYGSINTYSTYKTASSIGYVYNPNLDDQMNNKLRMYLPIKWSIVSRSNDIYGLNIGYDYKTPISLPNLIYPGEFVKKSLEVYGLYRVYFGFTSYSGKVVEDQVSFRIVVVRSSLETISESFYNSVEGYVLKYRFTAGAYTPFYLSRLYVVSNNTITVPGYVLNTLPVALYNQYLIIESLGYDLGVIYASKYLEGSVEVVTGESCCLEINIILWIIDYPVRCEGFYIYIDYFGELFIHDIVYPGIISSYVVLNNISD